MIVQWSDRYCMGVSEFDNDHKQLFQIAGKIIQTVNQHIHDSKMRVFMLREGIKYLKDYFDVHAVREEAYMRKIAYDGYFQHKRLHDEFRDIQLVKYDTILQHGQCTKDEILEFVGSGIGWLLEHVTTADMAIVGKGQLSRPQADHVNRETLTDEINGLFVSTLNLQVNAQIETTEYSGEPFGDAVYQQLTYTRGAQQITVMAGIEKRFLMRVARMIYGDEMSEADALILSTFEIFGANFWRTLASRFVSDNAGLKYKENHFLTQKQLEQKFIQRQPLISILFSSDQGGFFVASDDELLWKTGQQYAMAR
ncbi:MAG: hemerythrin family protein [Butyricicoccus sp.]|nr:hemerythrin family protein [Butyricicoccus sp.]